MLLGGLGETMQWYVMRDLKRTNAREPAYKKLAELKVEVYTPMRKRLVTRGGKRVREEVPFLQDLLFVHDTRSHLDPIVASIPTLQYRFVRGNAYRDPMVVREVEMQRFIQAVNTTDTPRYYQPGEITPAMYGRQVRIVGGPLDGYEGRLLSVRGARTRRLIVELPALLSVSVEVNPEYIQLL